MESSNNMCDFFESIKALFKFLSCINCIDCKEYDDEMNNGYIYDIQSERFINPIVNIVPKFDTPNEYECDEISDSIEDHVEINIIENYMDI